MTPTDLAMVIPAAPPRQSKGRLATVVGPEDRAALAHRQLRRTIRAARGHGPVVVVSRSPDLLAAAAQEGAHTLEEVADTLNGAVAQGLAWVRGRARAAVVLPTDLPLVTHDDIATLVAAAGPAERVLVVARCQRDDGSNGLLLRPPDLVAPAYGPGSARRHVAAAQAIGADAHSIFLPGFVDLDTPQDWARWGPGGNDPESVAAAPAVRSTEAGGPHPPATEAMTVTTVARTPAARFDDLDDWPHPAHHATIRVDGTQLRVAWVDEGPRDAHPVVLLHGEPTWGYLWRDVIPSLLAAGHRVVAPDLVGFGRSDKPQDREWYSYHRMADALDQTIAAAVGDASMTLVVHDWGGLLGLPWATTHPDQVERLVITNTALYRPGMRMSEAWQRFRDFTMRIDEFPILRIIGGAQASEVTPAAARAWTAPFPDTSYHAGPLAMPDLVVRADDMAGAAEHVAAWTALAQWDHAPVLVLWGAHDPIIPTVVGEAFASTIPAAGPMEAVEGAHFLQQDAGAEVGDRIAAFIHRT